MTHSVLFSRVHICLIPSRRGQLIATQRRCGRETFKTKTYGHSYCLTFQIYVISKRMHGSYWHLADDPAAMLWRRLQNIFTIIGTHFLNHYYLNVIKIMIDM